MGHSTVQWSKKKSQGREYSYGNGRVTRDDGFVVEGTWKNDELNGFCKLHFKGDKLPKPIDPKEFNTTILSYSGYIVDNRLEGQGTAVL